MPNTSKEKVIEFWKQCADINIVYDLYRRLFVADTRRFDLYDSVAPLSFRQLHGILKQYVILQFARITDTAKMRKDSNFTTNYILTEIDWPPDVHVQLKAINERLMSFREYITPARSKRIAHIDFNAQLIEREPLGKFPKNAEIEFLCDLKNFVNIAYGHFFNGDCVPITHVTSPDIDNLVQALEKARVFDLCHKCNETERTAALLENTKCGD